MKMQYLSLVLLLSLGGSMVAMDDTPAPTDATPVATPDATPVVAPVPAPTSVTPATPAAPASEAAPASTCETNGCVSSIKQFFCCLANDVVTIPKDLGVVSNDGDNGLLRHPVNFAQNVWGHRKAIVGTLAVVYVVNHLDEIKAYFGFGDDADEEEENEL